MFGLKLKGTEFFLRYLLKYLTLLFFLIGCALPSKKIIKSDSQSIHLKIHNSDSDTSFFSRFLESLFGYSHISIDSVPIVVLNIISPDSPKKILGLRFLIDTGSNVNIINSKKIPYIGKSFSHSTRTVKGEHTIKMEEVFLDVLKNSEFLGKDIPFYKTELKEEFSVDGILGNEFLKHFHVFIDYPHSIVLFPISESEPIHMEGFYLKKSHPEIQSHWVIKAEINGFNKNFIFDTGAGLSLINKSEIPLLKLQSARTVRSLNLASIEEKTRTFLAHKFCLNDKECLKNIEMVGEFEIENFFTGMSEVRASGLIGMNCIQNYSVFLNYQKRTIHFRKK